jgi:glyoxylase-like metal-dependent hydrolase (beta-lactamase superfamily II)
MDAAGLPPHMVRLAFASHFHCDHAGYFGWWREEYGTAVVLVIAEIMLTENRAA